MSDGCTSCGNKGGCDSRKHDMMSAIDVALAKAYPTRRWGEWDPEVAVADGVTEDEAEALAESLRRRLRTTVVRRAGREDELCDYLYVLCVGREPALAHLFSGTAPPNASYEDAEIAAESYLRVALSSVARLAAVQEVVLSLEMGSAAAGHAVLVEQPRAGVFSPVLLKRFQGVVAAIAEQDIRHLDFGDILTPPDGFDPGNYAADSVASGGGEGPPVVANYFFFPQPSTTLTAVPVALSSSLTSAS